MKIDLTGWELIIVDKKPVLFESTFRLLALINNYDIEHFVKKWRLKPINKFTFTINDRDMLCIKKRPKHKSITCYDISIAITRGLRPCLGEAYVNYKKPLVSILCNDAEWAVMIPPYIYDL